VLIGSGRRWRASAVAVALPAVLLLGPGLPAWAATPATVAAAADADEQPLPPGAARFLPSAPTRLVDSRTQPAYALRDQREVHVPVIGAGSPVPASATAVVLDVTITDATAPGFVTVWPTGSSRPATSALNVDEAGVDVANLAVVAVGAGGSVSISAQVDADVVVDLSGWFEPSGATAAGRFVAASGRVLDTRVVPGNRFRAGEARPLDVSDLAGPDPEAVVLSVVATDAAAPGYVTVWPGGAPRPLASNLNVPAAGTAGNLVVVAAPHGVVQLYAQEQTELVVDVVGFFTGPGAGVDGRGLFVPDAPVRVLDTRQGATMRPEGPTEGPVPAGREVDVPTTDPVACTGPGPAAWSVDAEVLNLTAVAPQAPGYVRVVRPSTGTSDLNVAHAGQTVARLTIADRTLVRGARWVVQLTSQTTTHLVADRSGWFLGPFLVDAPC
jgi:hypothetical protein